MLNYIWKIRAVPDEKAISRLVEKLKIPRSLARVLVARGIDSEEKAHNFFQPSLGHLYDPYLMDDMEKAVERTLKAVKEKEVIWIHGDYDVDGTASTAMLLQFLRELGAEVYYYIPDRFTDGYGISENSLKEAKKKNAKLLITVDIGINSVESIEQANQLGFDVIICDHHEAGDEIPNAFAILDPIKPNCKYPFKHLSACGVVFKFIQAIAKRINAEEKAYSYLDYVAIASSADMVPLIDENRILSYFGLQLLNNKPRPGIKGLLECTNVKITNNTITASNIVYALAPLINAAGRLGNASRAVEMMIQDDMLASFRIAQMLEQDNRMRRVYDEKTFSEAIPLAEEQLKNSTRRSLVLHSPNWHAGVIGIVASRLVDKFHLPTVLLTTIDNKAKGSARSIVNFDIHNALKKCSRFLLDFGGHKHAAGLSLEEKNIDEFREAFDEIARAKISDEMLHPEILIDAEIEFKELNPKFLQNIQKFAPFGFENNKPFFLTRGVVVSNGIKIIGNNHIKFRANHSNFLIDAIAHNLYDKISILTSKEPFSIVYNIEESKSLGSQTVQLRIKDLEYDNKIPLRT